MRFGDELSGCYQCSQGFGSMGAFQCPDCHKQFCSGCDDEHPCDPPDEDEVSE